MLGGDGRRDWTTIGDTAVVQVKREESGIEAHGRKNKKEKMGFQNLKHFLLAAMETDQVSKVVCFTDI